MDTKLAISKEVFGPQDEKMLVAVQVKRRTKKRIPFLATGGPGDYSTFICISKTKKKPVHVSITKVKRFEGSGFVRRSQWSIDQLRQVNGIDPNRDSPEFDLTFDTAFDQWVASSAGEKGIFIQVLHTTCQQHCSQSKPEFLNCQAHLLREEEEPVNPILVRCKKFLVRVKKNVVKGVRRHGSHVIRGVRTHGSHVIAGVRTHGGQVIAGVRTHSGHVITHVRTHGGHMMTGVRTHGGHVMTGVKTHGGHLLQAGNSILHTAADSVTSAVAKASQALNERGERLGRTEEKTADMMNSAQQFADTAHKLAMKHKC